jgi:hypothetical protein
LGIGTPYAFFNFGAATANPPYLQLTWGRQNVTANTTLYLMAQATFSSGVMTAIGVIRARRVR